MTAHEQQPQCPPVPDDVADTFWQSLGPIPDRLHAVANWGFAQALAAAQLLAAEERQKGADEELGGCALWVEVEYGSVAARELRTARRPPAPTLREQALAALRERLEDTATVRGDWDRNAMQLALQALEAGDG